MEEYVVRVEISPVKRKERKKEREKISRLFRETKAERNYTHFAY